MPAKEQSVESNRTCGAEFSFWSLKVSRNRDIPPRKLTWQWKIPPFKDVFHVEHEDFAIAMLVFGGVYFSMNREIGVTMWFPEVYIVQPSDESSLPCIVAWGWTVTSWNLLTILALSMFAEFFEKDHPISHETLFCRESGVCFLFRNSWRKVPTFVSSFEASLSLKQSES